jgi:hypothetical protein
VGHRVDEPFVRRDDRFLIIRPPRCCRSLVVRSLPSKNTYLSRLGTKLAHRHKTGNCAKKKDKKWKIGSKGGTGDNEGAVAYGVVEVIWYDGLLEEQARAG